MSNDNIKNLLTQLHRELKSAQKVDTEVVELFTTLDSDIHRLLESGGESTGPESVMKRAAALETRFAANHPVAEGLIREIINALGKMGV